MIGGVNVVEVGKTIIENKELVVLCLFLLLVIFISIPRKETGWEVMPPRGWKRRGKNMRKQRQEDVDSLLTSDFVDRVETRVYNGEITRLEATEAYRKLKRLYPIRNLFPSVALLKEKLKARQGTFTKPNLPDVKEKPRRKNMFETAPERVVL